MANTNKPKNQVLQRIDELCDQRGWTHYSLSKYSDVPYSSINNMYRRNTYPSLPLLFKLCNGLQIHTSDFFRDPARNDYLLTRQEGAIIELFRSLEFRNQELVLAYLQGLKKEGNQKETRSPRQSVPDPKNNG